MSGYSWCFFASAEDVVDGDVLSMLLPDVCFCVHFQVIQSTGASFQGYCQFYVKHTSESLKSIHPEFNWEQSSNELEVYSAYVSFTGGVSRPSVYGQPRPKDSRPAFKNMFTSAKAIVNRPEFNAKAVLKNKAKKFACELFKNALE